MKRNDQLIKKVYDILSLLNLNYCSNNLICDLFDGKEVTLFNGNNNLGRMYFLNDEVYAEVMYENQILVLKGKNTIEEQSLFDIYIYKTNENKNMKLEIEFITSSDKKHATKTTCVIFGDNLFINRAKFHSKDQFFRLTYPDEHLFHSSYKINHEKKDKITNIEIDSGLLIYEVDTMDERHKCGALDCFEYIEDYETIDEKISDIIKEVDGEYYDLLIKEKEILDDFIPNLFDNICLATYKKYSSSQFKNILNIEKNDYKCVKNM